jgi:acetyl-CoA C-acetyltransferase
VILGQCYPNGESPAIGRVVVLDAGLPVTTTGYQLDRRCGSGLQAVLNGVMQIEAGRSNVVIAGGVESMSQAEYYATAMRWGARGENQQFYDRLAPGRVTAGGRRTGPCSLRAGDVIITCVTVDDCWPKAYTRDQRSCPAT